MPFGKSPACFCSCFLLLLVKIAFWRRGARRAPRTVVIASTRCAQPSSVHRALSAITRGTQSLNAEEGFYLADRSTCRISGGDESIEVRYGIASFREGMRMVVTRASTEECSIAAMPKKTGNMEP